MKLEKNAAIYHFKILSEIGMGGMGEVYLRQDTNLDRKVAIKFLNEKFFEMWKDADKDMPALIAGKKEYAELD